HRRTVRLCRVVERFPWTAALSKRRASVHAGHWVAEVSQSAQRPMGQANGRLDGDDFADHRALLLRSAGIHSRDNLDRQQRIGPSPYGLVLRRLLAKNWPVAYC